MDRRRQVKGEWYLCGDVQSALFAMMKAEIRDAVSVRLTAFNTPAGGSYAVVSHQLFGWAHRFILPLYEPDVGMFLLGMQRDEMGFMFGNNGATDAVLLHSPLKGPAFAPMLTATDSLTACALREGAFGHHVQVMTVFGKNRDGESEPTSAKQMQLQSTVLRMMNLSPGFSRLPPGP